ncbi:hypothetical protein P7H55_09395 [Vagococcus lutrae]|uniref:hypothetical protein n=1 Tax=Vagococcus lutrae TaxID=81947 RepID=UPI00288CD6CE|nr:hypothetical protein [Vagococcus lutrae]MDT2818053.1 hypothetical protein [Vagococcus lutrae]
MKIDRRALFMPMIQEAIEKHREDESLQDLRIKYGEEDYHEALILAVYDDIQRDIDNNELSKGLEREGEKYLLELAITKREQLNLLEKELYRIKEGNMEAALWAFYIYISDEKIELFELIKSQVYQVI